MKERLTKLDEEIEVYKQAIRDAQDALASAEQEMDKLLAAASEQEQPPWALDE